MLKTFLWLGGLTLIVLALIAVIHAGASGEDRPPADALARQQPTATPGFGPLVTSAPTATPDPSRPTATPTITAPTPTRTPAPQATRTPLPEGTPLPTYEADKMGIQIDPAVSVEDFDAMLWLADRLGVKWIKLQFAWDLLEPQPGQLSDAFYKYRLFVQQADQYGFNVMISIAKAPGWARASQDEDGPPANPQDLANFITRIMGEVRVDLYGNSYFDAIEVWNEPNLRREWNGGALSGAAYMQLFDAAYHAIRAGEGGHSVTIVTAGLAPTGINDGVGAVDDRAYLRQMYQAGLNNPAYQQIAIGVHPYGAANAPDARCCGTRGYDDHPSWFFLHTLEDYWAIMQEAGDTGRQLWATEFGWWTYEGFTTSEGTPVPAPPGVPYFQWIDQITQANYIMRAFEIGQSLPYLGPMVLWNLNYGSQDYIDAQDERAAYALLRGGIDPLRPAFLLIEQAPKR